MQMWKASYEEDFDMEFLPIIIISSIGLSLCVSYLLYHAVGFFRRRRKSPVIKEEDVYVYCDEQEKGDSLIINLQNINDSDY